MIGSSRPARRRTSRPTSAATPGRSSTSTSSGDEARTLVSRTSGLAEVVIPPRSDLIGEIVFPGMVTDSGDLVVLAIQRKGEELGAASRCWRSATSLLLQGSWTALDENLDDPDVLVVDAARRVRRQVVPLGLRAARGDRRPRRHGRPARDRHRPVGRSPGCSRPARWSCSGVVSPSRAPTSRSLDDGRARGRDDPAVDGDDRRPAPRTSSADTLVGVVRRARPVALLAGLFLITATLGQLISNMATALIVIPIAVAAAAWSSGSRPSRS